MRVQRPPLTLEERARLAAASDQRAAETEAREKQVAAAKLAGEWRAFLSQCGQRYAHVELSNFVATTPAQKNVLAGLREYISESVQASVLFYGPCGTGKDHLAISLIRNLVVNHRLSPLRINGPEWFGALRDRITTERPERDVIKSLSEPGVLLLSDPLPPKGDLSDYQASMLYRVVEARCSAGKTTITTVNVSSGQEAVQRMGAATWDRLKDGAWVVGCNWPSHRKPARELG